MYGIKCTVKRKRQWVKTSDGLGVLAFTTKLDAKINLPKILNKTFKNARISKLR